VQVVLLVQSSVAVQVTVVAPSGNRLPDAGVQTTATSESALSVAVGVGYVATAPLAEQATRLMLAGQMMVGFVVSRATVTVKLQFVLLLQSSVAVQVTVVVPGGKRLPDGGEQVTVTFVSALSVAVGGGQKTRASGGTAVQSQAMRFVGHWMTGGVVSRATVTLNVHTADSRQEFVARQVTGVVPRANTAPDGGLHVTVGFPMAQSSVAVGGG
jgi:hypothetical protein